MPHVCTGQGQPSNMIGPYKRKKWINTCIKNSLLFPTCDIAIVLGLPNSPGLYLQLWNTCFSYDYLN